MAHISPAISLPTSSDQRAVDAGYYDNCGIDLLTASLGQPVEHGFQEVLQKRPGRSLVGLVCELYNRELARSVNGYEQIELPSPV